MSIRAWAFVAAICVAALCAAGPVMAADSAAAGQASDQQIVHLLNRIGFGPTPEAVAHVRQIGIERYIAEQLDPDSISEPPALTARLAAFDTLPLDSAAIFKEYGPPPSETKEGAKPTPEQVQARIKRSDSVREQASEARLYRALYSRRQLEEAMVDFWFNHFNVFVYKGFVHFWIGSYEAQAIRPHVLGRFRDLVLATAQHPAMLFYLDNQINTAPGSPHAHGIFTGLNENYAREIMELHTLGVDGGYTQDDVVTLARIFTGWGFDYKNMQTGVGAASGFDPKRHDDSDKVFLGHKIPGGGRDEGVAAIDILAKSPATAHHIAYQLAQYFVADEPPPELVNRLAARFLETDGDIKVVMAALLASREFRDSTGQKYKTPYQYVLSAVRAGGIDVKNPKPLLGTMARLGMPLYQCQTPDGYKNTEAAWLSPDATSQRINFATLLGSGAFQLHQPPAEEAAPPAMNPSMGAGAAVEVKAASGDKPKPIPVDAAKLETLLAPVLSERTRVAVAEEPDWLKAGLLLGSPDFMRR